MESTLRPEDAAGTALRPCRTLEARLAAPTARSPARRNETPGARPQMVLTPHTGLPRVTPGWPTPRGSGFKQFTQKLREKRRNSSRLCPRRCEALLGPGVIENSDGTKSGSPHCQSQLRWERGPRGPLETGQPGQVRPPARMFPYHAVTPRPVSTHWESRPTQARLSPILQAASRSPNAQLISKRPRQGLADCPHLGWPRPPGHRETGVILLPLLSAPRGPCETGQTPHPRKRRRLFKSATLRQRFWQVKWVDHGKVQR